MDLAWLFPYVLFLHVLGAIIAFGPTFSFSIMGAMGGAEPQHANFATRVSARISDRIIKPLAIFQGITGVLLIWISGRDLMASTWLLVAIVLYLLALYYALFVQSKHVARVIELTSAPPPPDAPAHPRPHGGGQRGPAGRDDPRDPDRRHRLPDGGQAVLTP